jgi:tetratricopeptide (TPR) repeat protein
MRLEKTLMKKFLFIFYGLVFMTVATGCGTVNHKVDFKDNYLPPSGTKIELGRVVNKTGEEFDIDIRGMLSYSLEKTLKEKELLWSSYEAPRLLLESNIIEYKKGDAFKRWLLPGWGATILIVRCDLVDDDNNIVGSVKATRTVSAGGAYTIGAWKTIFDNLANDVVEDLSKSFLSSKERKPDIENHKEYKSDVEYQRPIEEREKEKLAFTNQTTSQIQEESGFKKDKSEIKYQRPTEEREKVQLSKDIFPAQAIFCSKCGTQNPDDGVFCIKCGRKLIHLKEGSISKQPTKLLDQKEGSISDQPTQLLDQEKGKGSIFDQATELLWQEKCDEAISLIEKNFGPNPNDMKAKVSLAKAYLAKCEMLKEKSDKQYKSLAFRPLEIGRSILHSPDGNYICAHAFLINNRPERARKYVNKAIGMSISPRPEYYFVLGDSWVATSSMSMRVAPDLSPEAEEAYEKVINMNVSNDVKALAYYKLAVMCSEFGRKEKAKMALRSALELTQSEALIKRIRGMSGIDIHQTASQIQKESRLKLAILPWKLVNNRTIGDTESSIRAQTEFALKKAIKTDQIFIPEFSYYDLEQVKTKKISNEILNKTDLDNLWIRKNIFSSFIPNVDLICNIGKKLNVDAILTYYISIRDYSEPIDVDAFLINVKTKKIYHARRSDQSAPYDVTIQFQMVTNIVYGAYE